MNKSLSNPKPPRVLQVFHCLGMGGAETWLIEMLRRWSATNEVQCDFLFTSSEIGAFDREARELGAQLFVAPFGRGHLFSFARQLRRVLRQGNYDAIHDHQDRASGWHFALAYPFLPKVCVTHIHNPSYQIANNYETSLARRLTAGLGRKFISRFTTHIAATSYQVIEEYGFNSKQFAHIPKAALHCAFNTERFAGSKIDARNALINELGISDQSKLILFAGRMDQSAERNHPLNHKNSAFAFDVAFDLFASRSDVHMAVAGATTGALTEFQERIRTRGMQDRFHILGIRKDINRLMLASDLLFFPSRGEGLGMVAVEAQACGLPVLASTAVPKECVVLPELVSFLDLKEPISTWANKISELLNLPRVDSHWANQAIAASAFSVPVCSDRLISLYKHGML